MFIVTQDHNCQVKIKLALRFTNPASSGLPNCRESLARGGARFNPVQVGFGTQNEGRIVDGRRGHAAVVKLVRGEHVRMCDPV